MLDRDKLSSVLIGYNTAFADRNTCNSCNRLFNSSSIEATCLIKYCQLLGYVVNVTKGKCVFNESMYFLWATTMGMFNSFLRSKLQ